MFFYYVRRSVLFNIHAANIEASKFFVLFLSVIMEIIPKDLPNASSMYMLLLQLSYIFLREYSSQKYNSDPEGCPVDWQDLMMVLTVQ